MNLRERLMADLKQALRDKDAHRKDAIRMVRAAIKNADIDLQRDTSKDEIQSLISREVRRRTEALEIFRQAGREDLVAEEERGLVVLRQYLPEHLSRDQIFEVAQQIVTELGATGPTQLGPMMRRAMAQLRGKADGRLVKEMAQEILAG